MNWLDLYEMMMCRDRWVFESRYFRSENLIALESVGMLNTILDDMEIEQ